ncbi:MAG TPA: hypothetical protein EYN21_04675 [Candidatus Marinimicrobia bacterium]|nr:hypothetical protein [Candidatus Neomarinimicrobiota bacterium]
MCGIFGVIAGNGSELTTHILQSTVNDLFRLSESRGKEAAGIAVHVGNTIYVYKEPVAATTMLRSREYRKLYRRFNGIGSANQVAQFPVAVMGHSRLVTSGLQDLHHNNQPVISHGVVGVHNGIIVNDQELWQQFPSMQRRCQVDTEVLLGLIRKFYRSTPSLVGAVRQAFRYIRGESSIAAFFEDLDYVVLATNTGSLYVSTNRSGNTFVFASERYILQMLMKKNYIKRILGQSDIVQIPPGTGWLVSLSNLHVEKFLFEEKALSRSLTDSTTTPKNILDISPSNGDSKVEPREPVSKSAKAPPQILEAFGRNERAIASLRRCKKCVLPETMPCIVFDEEGICNFCRNYRKIKLKGRPALERAVSGYRRKSGDPDCIVMFSGGRDSSYGLHYIKNVLKLNPIAYTYDWGMVTDLARRNQARLCGQLGVEHIWVSADITQKRENIRKNVTAWLKRPDMGMIPLFMAGDKQFFYHANKLKKQTGIKLTILCENMLEKTDFKSGFCGIKPAPENQSVYSLSPWNKVKILSYYSSQYSLNPSYLNSSLVDTLWAYASYYLINHDFLSLYQYLDWDERELESTLISEYDWEVAPDSKTTWRIGDGTAPFYNYLYYMIAGFTENDTFRSNQIREEMITRDEALVQIREDNQPRYASIEWYCDVVGLDFEETLRTIHTIPKLFQG